MHTAPQERDCSSASSFVADHTWPYLVLAAQLRVLGPLAVEFGHAVRQLLRQLLRLQVLRGASRQRGGDGGGM